MHSFCDCGVYKVLNLCARESWRHLSKRFSLDLVTARYFVKVKLEDVLSTVYVWMRNVDFLIKSTWPCGCCVKRVLVVCSSNYHDVFVFLKAIHLSQHLVYGGST